jgi:glycosyltransferase involved in cell wall biosynthesis
LTEIAVVGQDPRFGGGALALMLAFWEAALSLGRHPHLVYLEHPSLSGRIAEPPLDVPGARPPFGHVDALNQLWGARRLAPRLEGSQARWLVATTASYGASLLRGGRPFRCWVATTLDDEWGPQLALLPRSRRLARAVNGPILRAVERRVLRAADAVYTISPAASLAVRRSSGLPESRVRVIPLPVDGERFSPIADADYVAGLDAPTNVFVGRAHEPRKNVALLLAAWPSIVARHPRARLRLVGRPPHASLPPRVDAVGGAASVESELRAASLLVLPSTQEGFGLVAAEALAAGVPVVTTPSGGPEELVRGSNGGVVLAGFGADELAAEVGALLDDAGSLIEMRSKGRAYVEREHSRERTRDAIADAIAEGRQRVR